MPQGQMSFSWGKSAAVERGSKANPRRLSRRRSPRAGGGVEVAVWFVMAKN